MAASQLLASPCRLFGKLIGLTRPPFRKIPFPSERPSIYFCSDEHGHRNEAAIKSLPEPERQRLESWFIAQRSIDDAALERELTIAIEEAHSSPEERRLPAIRRRRMIGNVLPY